MRGRRLAGILAALPNLAAAAGLILYFHNNGEVPKSLTVALGGLADAFSVLLIIAVVTAGLLAIPQHPRMLYAEAAARPLAAATLLSYAVAVGASPTTAWITVGFATASGLEQLRRWHIIATILIPEAKAVAALKQTRKQVD